MANEGGAAAETTRWQGRGGAQPNRHAVLPPETQQVEEEEKRATVTGHLTYKHWLGVRLAVGVGCPCIRPATLPWVERQQT